MKKRDIIGRVLFWLGMLLGIGGILVLMYFDTQAVIWSDECDRVTAAVVIGLIMMAVSIAMDLLPKRKGDKMVYQYGSARFDDVTGDVFEDERVNEEDRLDDEYYHADECEDYGLDEGYDFNADYKMTEYLDSLEKKENRADS